MDVVSGTALYAPSLGCGSGACRAEATTVVTVTALGGATFTDAPGTTVSWVTGAGVAQGSCVVTDATTVTCQPSGAPGMTASDRSTFLRAETPFAVSVPGTIAALDPVLQASWTDSVQIGTNNPADDTLSILRNGATDWQAFSATVGVSTAKTMLPPLRFTCVSADCGVTPTSPFRVDAVGSTTFTDAVGATFAFGSGVFAGLCTVQSATALSCLPEFPAFATGGTDIDLPRLGFDAGGAGVGAHLAAALAPADDNAENNTMDVFLQAPGPADNGDWAAVPSRLWISASAMQAPQATFQCLTLLCETGPSTGFRVDALAGATFTAPVGTAIPFNPLPVSGTCTVDSATTVLCVPSEAVEATAGTLVTLPRLDVSLPGGASAGTTLLRAGLIGPDADDANDAAAFVVNTPAMLMGRLAFFEGFEYGQGLGATPLTDYVGAAPWGETYTADAAWLANCNGTIQSFGLPDATLPKCPNSAATGGLKVLSWALGSFAPDLAGGPDPADNHALGSYTNATVTSGEALALAGIGGFDVMPGHYYAASFDYAAHACAVRGARYVVSLGAPGEPATALHDGVVNPCLLYQETITDPGASLNYVGRYVTDAYRATGSKLAFRLANLETSGTGNDSAIDNLAVYDVSPTLEKSFAPSSGLTAGQRSRLTFTITNSEERGAKADWRIEDALPAGLVVASDPAVSGDCASQNVTAASGASIISAVGSLAAGSSGCEISVWVVASSGGTFSNCAANLAASSGLIPPSACAQVSYAATPSSSADPTTRKHKHRKNKHRKPRLTIKKSASTGFARPGSVVAYTITVRNMGNRAARSVKVCDEPPRGLRTLRSEPVVSGTGSICWRLKRLAAEGKRTFRLTARVAAGVRSAVVRNVATVSAANVKGRRTDRAGVRVKPLPDTACGSRLMRPTEPGFEFLC
ncbi:MAG: hypothetical protein R2725_14630 [Solirubrobacterales bacterium]